MKDKFYDGLNNNYQAFGGVSSDDGFEGDPAIVASETEREREENAKNARAARLEKLAERREEYAEREATTGGGKRNKRDGKTGFIVAIAALGTVCLILATVLMVNIFSEKSGEDDRYIRAAYYNFTDYVEEMDDDLNKLVVTTDKKAQQKYLSKLSVASALAAESVSALPVRDESKYNTVKFVNQVSDYAKYLNNQLIDGYSLTEKDKENLKSISGINGTLMRELSELSAELDEDFDFKSLLGDTDNNAVLKRFDKLEENAVDYPKLIYDGPFSDALDRGEPKGLNGEEISLAEAKEIFGNFFGKEGFENVEEDGETDDVIPTYNFKGRVDDDVEVYARISKKGGRIVAFTYFADCDENKFDLDSCVKIGEELISALGIDGMKAVWATDSGPAAAINFAFEKDGVIVYNDMIKLTVCKERGLVSNFDAREYYLNHTERNIASAAISAEKARESVSDSLEIGSVRKALIPYGENREILAYEFEAFDEDTTYYIYIDASSGEQGQIFRVIETAEGKLLK